MEMYLYEKIPHREPYVVFAHRRDSFFSKLQSPPVYHETCISMSLELDCCPNRAQLARPDHSSLLSQSDLKRVSSKSFPHILESLIPPQNGFSAIITQGERARAGRGTAR